MKNAFDFCYWNIMITKPYYDETRDQIKAYKLQMSGHRGFCVSNYSKMELDAIKAFAKETGSYILEYYEMDEYDKLIGSYSSKSFCVWTKYPNDFEDIFKKIPARNKLICLDKKLKKKITYENYCYFIGEEKIVLTYSESKDYSIKDHIDIMKVLTKLTK